MSCEGVCEQGRKPCPTPGACRAWSTADVVCVVAMSCFICLSLMGALIWLL